MKQILISITLLLTIGTMAIQAEDWPEFRGKGRVGIWNETNTIDKFPDGGLEPIWRVPIHAGMSGPAVADGRVLITDFKAEDDFYRGTERVLALDEETGHILWTREWKVDYAAGHVSTMPWGGPLATPTVDDNRVYVLGRTGVLLALDTATGDLLWKTDFKDYSSETVGSGNVAHPLVEGDVVICFVGGVNANVVAFDKMTGEESSGRTDDRKGRF